MTYRNLVFTMLLHGLWHATGWIFVIWGGSIGLMLAFHQRCGGAAPANAMLVPGDAWQILLSICSIRTGRIRVDWDTLDATHWCPLHIAIWE